MGAADVGCASSAQFTTGDGDYTEERKELFKDLTLEEVVDANPQSRSGGTRRFQVKGNASGKCSIEMSGDS